MQDRCTIGSDELWGPSRELSDRVSRLRSEYFNINEREYFRNEMLPFTTGTEWDVMWSPALWGVVPDLIAFNKAFLESLPMLAEKVDLPDGFWEKPHVVRVAMFFREVISRYLPVDILEGELIVGGRFNVALSRAHTRNESRRWMKKTKKFMKETAFMDTHGMGNLGATPGHIIPDYKRALRMGLGGMVAYFQELADKSDDHGHREFLSALVICCEGARELAARYAGEARRLAEKAGEGERREELLEIARICGKVPWEPPETFHEALQALWFIHMLVMVQESYPGPGVSPGRVDQYLYSFYRDDISEGRLSREEARELLQCFWIKPNYAYDFMYRLGRNHGITSGYGQLVTIGGHGPDGEDVSNDLTWLILDVIEDMNLLEPKPNVRLHKKTPDDLMRRVASMVAGAQGSPFLLNFDEASIRALKWQGLPEEDLAAKP